MIEERIQRVQETISKKKIDALMVLFEENRYYLSGFTAQDHQFDESAGVLLISKDKLILATDSRFETQANEEASLYDVFVYQKGLAKALPELAKMLNISTLGFENGRVSVKQYEAFKKALVSASIPLELVSVEEIVEALRLVKSSDEIEKTRKALSLAEDAYRHVAKTLKPGMTEKKIAWDMECKMRLAGAAELSFPVIVAAGPNSALPHAIPTDRPIQKNEPILFDWGAIAAHYCSDTSRTVYIGKPDNTFLDVYHTVLDAQQKAIQAITEGADSKAIDAIARNHISEKGYGDKFGHGLGHGTGLAVHEGPRLSPLRKTDLKSGMIVTVEPGIYLPGWGGVRIENQVVVKKNGADILNQLSLSYHIDEI